MENSNITLFGETDFRNQKRRFGIKEDDRRRHMYIIGKTGTGKTTLLENMAIQDIQNGHGIAIVDPHGEFAEKMLDFVPSSRINDVIYFNPADLDFPIAFNAIETVDAEHRHLVASGLVGVFKKIWAETWGPRLEYLLRNAILALLEYPGATLLGVMRLLVDKTYRQKVMDKVTDPVVKSFWVDEFSKYKGNFEVEAIAPIQNKVGQFLTNPLIRNIVGQTKSSINIREIMDSEKIFIMNLSKGKIGEDTSNLLGAMLITRLQLAAMSRVDIPEDERKDFYLYVDEFQNFATESFANILSEARKYHLSLVLAHQYIAQVREEVRDAVFGNVGTMVSFRVGAADADFLEKEFEPEFTVNDMVGLGFAQIYLKLMIDGFSSRPFSARTLAPIRSTESSSKEKIVRVSRERYGRSRQEIEDKIMRWSGLLGGENEGASAHDSIGGSERSSHGDPNVPMFKDKCSECGKEVEVPFKPDGVRPVYCKDCLIKTREKGASPGTQKPAENFAPQKHNNFPQDFKNGSEPVLKRVGETVSLRDAFKTGPVFCPPAPKRQHKEVDLRDLRETLKEITEGQNRPPQEPEIKEKPHSFHEEKKQDSPVLPKNELNPGESVDL